MIYYTSDGRKITYNAKKEEYISSGMQGSIFKIDESKCIKLYYDLDITVFNQQMFEQLRELKLDNYCKLYDLLFDNDKNRVLAYTMKYYQKSEDNILFMPVDYTLYNFEVLYNSIMILADNEIMAKDLYYRNIVVGDNEMTVIDLDNYSRSNLSNDVLAEVNLTNLLYAFKGVYKEAFRNIGIDPMEDEFLDKKIDSLFSYTRNADKTLVRKLSQYHRPIDLLYRK